MKTPEFNPNEVEQKIESWKNGPVVLASSSRYRLEKLAELGYKNVATISVPDEEEKREHTEIVETEGKIGHWYDKYKVEIPQRIAAAKVEYLIAHENIPDNVMVVALDTLPTSFPYNTREEMEADYRLKSWTAKHLSKPTDRVSAISSILEVFNNVANGRRNLLDSSRDYSEETLRILNSGYLGQLVKINTGMAIRFPNDPEIYQRCAEVKLMLHQVYDYRDQPEKIRELAEQVADLMEKSGALTRIAGGIDYSSPEIRQLLRIEECDFFEEKADNEGIYKGFPKEQFEEFVMRGAQGTLPK